MSGPKVQPNFSIPPGIASEPVFLDFVEQIRKRLVDVAGVINAGQFPGTATNDNAQTGDIGEYVSSVIGAGTPVALTSNTTSNVTSKVLGPGDWKVWGEVWFTSSVNQTSAIAGINTTSATLPAVGDGTARNQIATTSTGLGTPVLPLVPCRISVPAGTTTTVYLVARPAFASGTCSAWGKLCARRVR